MILVCLNPLFLFRMKVLLIDLGKLSVLWLGIRRREVLTAEMMSSTLARAPLPTSLQASCLLTGAMMENPMLTKASSCVSVSLCSYMTVFIAGQRMAGLPKSQALTTLRKRLSAIPRDILAMTSALAGQTSSRSAALRSSMCSTGSPILSQLHSCSSVRTEATPPNSRNLLHLNSSSDRSENVCYHLRCRVVLLGAPEEVKCCLAASDNA